MTALAKSQHRPLHKIATEIAEDWGLRVSPHAQPYLDAMFTLNSITDMYGYDSAEGVVRRFLVNASGWRGDVARRIKTELRAMVN